MTKELMIAFLLVALPACAQTFTSVKPSIQGQGAGSEYNKGDLSVNFTETGLSESSVNYTLSASNTATYTCPDGSTVTFGGAEQSQPSDRVVSGGKVKSAMFLGHAPYGGGCPTPSPILTGVSYTNILLKDTTNNMPASVADTSAQFGTQTTGPKHD